MVQKDSTTNILRFNIGNWAFIGMRRAYNQYRERFQQQPHNQPPRFLADVDGVVTDIGMVSIGAVHDGIAAEHPVGLTHQKQQHGKFCLGKTVSKNTNAQIKFMVEVKAVSN